MISYRRTGDGKLPGILTKYERCFGQHQNRYRLEDYLPLLEVRSRAFFNAAPVRQNIPPEVLQRWQEERTDHKTIIAFLKAQADAELPRIEDPVRIRAVNLHEYDILKGLPMYNDATMEQVKILAKQLKIPTFVRYPDLLRQAGADTDFGSILLTLMRNEYDQRQENQNRRRLKQEGFRT